MIAGRCTWCALALERVMVKGHGLLSHQTPEAALACLRARPHDEPLTVKEES